MQLINKFNKGFRFLLCVIDVFSKYDWVVKVVSIGNAFQNILKRSNRKRNKIWVDKGRELSNNCFKKWLQDNDIQCMMKENLLLLKDFVRTLKKNNLQIHDFSIKKCVY